MAANQLDIHFLNVGHGDCTIIDFPSGHLSMIDINNSKSLPMSDEIALAEERGISLSMFKSAAPGKMSWEDYYRSLLVDPAEYFSEHFGGRSLFRYVQSHPDMDHMSGLCRLFWQVKVNLENFWDITHAKEWDEDTFDKSRYDWDDLLVYRRMRKGYIQDDNTHRVIHNVQGDQGDYWTQDGITVLAPTAELIAACDTKENWNNASQVLAVQYAGRKVILAGDSEVECWDSIEDYAGDWLKCDILKAAHHGRLSGYSESATDIMDPAIVVCSVGKKPATDASSQYRAGGAEVLSTRFNGTIHTRIYSNGAVTLWNHKGEVISSLPRLS
jgi:competence protein ComEC